jgi:hypothetical protein
MYTVEEVAFFLRGVSCGINDGEHYLDVFCIQVYIPGLVLRLFHKFGQIINISSCLNGEDTVAGTLKGVRAGVAACDNLGCLIGGAYGP